MEWIIRSTCPPVVTTAEAADRTVRFAVRELRHYLGAMLGNRRPAAGAPVLDVAVTPQANGDPEAYTIRIRPEGAAITGNSPAGALYGVYEMLRRFCGCRFANPLPDGEFIPRCTELRLPCGEYRYAPRIALRGMQLSRKDTPARLQGQIDWMMKIGLNTVMIIPTADDDPGGESVARDPATGEDRRGGGDLGYNDAWYRKHLRPAIRKRGMQVCMANHNFRRWVPPHRYFRKHPEWYAEWEGKRNPWIGQMCLCTSNEAMVATLIQQVRKHLRANPEIRIIGVCPEDGYGWCQCAACRALDDDPRDAFQIARPNYRTPEGENRNLIRRHALLLNQVARALRDEFPDVLVYYGAYISLQWPPRDVVLEANIAVMVALYWRCGAHPIAPDRCEMNRFFFDLLDQWRRVHRGPLYIHDYYYGMDCQRALPYPMGDVICANWPGYHQLGIRGAKTNTRATHLAALGLNYLAFARCGWEASVDYPALRDEFLEGMFGAAAPALRPVYEALDNAVTKVAAGRTGGSPYLAVPPPAKGCLLPNGRNIGYFLDEIGADTLDQGIRRAETLAGTGRERRQVARFKSAVRYWRLSRECTDHLMAAETAEAGGDPGAAAHYRQALTKLNQLVDWCSRNAAEGWAVAPDAFHWQARALRDKTDSTTQRST